MPDSELKDTMDTILNVPTPTIKESIFKRDLLPCLVNQDEESADLRLWLKIAGSWTRSINVVDDSNSDLLFVVPPLVGSIKTEIAKSGHSSASEILKTAQRKSQVTDRAGREYLLNQFNERAQADGSTFITNVRAWNTIYERYGFDDLIRDESPLSKEKDSVNTAGDSVEPAGYDDL